MHVHGNAAAIKELKQLKKIICLFLTILTQK